MIIFVSFTIFPYTSAISHIACPFEILVLNICAIIFTKSSEFAKNLAAINWALRYINSSFDLAHTKELNSSSLKLSPYFAHRLLE